MINMIDSPSDLLILIIVILIVFFGSSKIPEIFRSLGRATGEFKKGQLEAEMEIAKMQSEASQKTIADLESKIRELEKQIEELKKQQIQAK